MSFFKYSTHHGILWWIFVGSWVWMFWGLYYICSGTYKLYDKILGDNINDGIKGAFATLTILVISVLIAIAIPSPSNTSYTGIPQSTQAAETTSFLDKLKADRTSDIIVTTEPEIETTAETTAVTQEIIPTVTEQQSEEKQETEVETTKSYSIKYVLNTNTMKFHASSCRYVKSIKPHNYAEYIGTRDEVIADGYSPCGVCKP